MPQGRSSPGFPQGSRMQQPRPTPWTTQGREQDMYALIREYNGLDTKTQETATRKANAELRPILAKSPGFVSFELIKPEDKNNVVASITVFKTRKDADASSKVSEDWVHKNLPSMTKMSKLDGELVVH
jgi:heme-degrading monooxygenase HmoA